MKFIVAFALLTAGLRQPRYASFYTLLSTSTSFKGCGHLSFAYQFLFLDNKDSSTFLGIIYCPDGFKNGFFKEDARYQLQFSKDTIINKMYVWGNRFDNDTAMRLRIIEDIKLEE